MQDMVRVGSNGRLRWKLATQFDLGRALIPGQIDQTIGQATERFGAKTQRGTMVGKWQGYPTAASQETAHLHHRKAGTDTAVGIAHGDDERPVAIAVGQQSCPGRVMENLGLGVCGRQGVPAVRPKGPRKVFRVQESSMTILSALPQAVHQLGGRRLASNSGRGFAVGPAQDRARDAVIGLWVEDDLPTKAMLEEVRRVVQ